MYTSIDLFAGPGGICTGFKWAGIKPLISVEMSDWTVETYKASHNADVLDLKLYLDGELDKIKHIFKPSDKTVLIHGDIRDVSNELIDKILKERFNTDTVDIVTGGAPCESFSMAGKRNEEDERNNLFLNLERIAKHVDSKMVLFENVRGLFSKKLDGKAGKMYESICDEFESENDDGIAFKLASREKDVVLMKASEYGVPQDRERIILVGVNKKYNSTFNYPEKTHGPGKQFDFVTVEDAIMDLPTLVDPKQGEEEIEYQAIIKENYSEKRKRFLAIISGVSLPKPSHIEGINVNSHITPGHTDKMLNRLSYIKQGEGMKAAAERLIEEGKSELRTLYFPNKLYAARNRRLKINKPSFTMTSHCLDEAVHPIYNRGLTPREAARLQSFPDWYIFKGPYVKFHSDPEQDRYEQIGDAIPPIFAYAIGVEVVKTLEDIYLSI